MFYKGQLHFTKGDQCQRLFLVMSEHRILESGKLKEVQAIGSESPTRHLYCLRTVYVLNLTILKVKVEEKVAGIPDQAYYSFTVC